MILLRKLLTQSEIMLETSQEVCPLVWRRPTNNGIFQMSGLLWLKLSSQLLRMLRISVMTLELETWPLILPRSLSRMCIRLCRTLGPYLRSTTAMGLLVKEENIMFRRGLVGPMG